MFAFNVKMLNVARTSVHFFMFIILGLMTSIPGPTLIDLRHSSHSDGYSISFLFTARSIGYLIGSLVGGIVLDCMRNEEVALLLSSLFIALGAYAIPWARSLPVLLGTFAITGFAMGFSNTGSNTSCLRIWGKKGAPFLQALHFFYGIGGFLAPILAAPFLSASDLSIDIPLLDMPQNSSELPSLLLFSNITHLNVDEVTVPTITYVYTIIGVLATLVSGCFAGIVLIASKDKNISKMDTEDNVRDPGLTFTVIVVILACLQCGLISGVEVSFTQMLTSYVVQSSHGLTKVDGSYITSVFWGTYTATRLISIFLACKINVRKLLTFDLALTVTANIILLTIGTWSVTGLWIGTALLGISVASIFPGTLSWIEKYININNRIASVFTLVSSVLEMTVPLSISIYLSSQPDVLFHFMTTATVTVCVLFIILNVILTRKGEKYQLPTENHQETKQHKPTTV